MRKRFGVVIVMCALLLCSCTGKNSGKSELRESQLNTNVMNEVEDNLGSNDGGMVDYTENEDGTYSTDKYTYQYKLRLPGRENCAEKDSWFLVLTNNKDVTFQEVSWSLFSSQMSDGLKEEETVIVDMGVVED